jgi:death on curing protein
MIDREPQWISARLAVAIHDRQLAEHGGSSGVRDMGLLESAPARPQHAYTYGEADLPALAAAYAFGIARNHPFVDGNKRTAYVVCRTFLLINGWDFSDRLEERYAAMIGLAAGEIDEDEFASWLRERVHPTVINERRARYRR